MSFIKIRGGNTDIDIFNSMFINEVLNSVDNSLINIELKSNIILNKLGWG
ncbi:MAG: hypothetical protein ACW98D_19150 [Promethearchaeota archaeon]|jgi:hypothetical protein